MKRRLLAILLSLTLMLSLIPSAWAVENGESSQEPAVYVREDNPYSDDGITIDGVTVSDGLATVKVSYAKANQMAGIAYSYTLDGKKVTDRATATASRRRTRTISMAICATVRFTRSLLKRGAPISR